MLSDSLMGFGKFVAGALIGALALAIYNQTNPDPPGGLTGNATWGTSAAPSGPDPHDRLAALSHELDVTVELAQQLAAQIEDMNLRLSELEQLQQEDSGNPQSTQEQAPEPRADKAAPEQEQAQAQTERQTGTLTLEALVEAGIDQAQADYILRTQGELDLQRLELRDRAIRDGTLGTKEYVNALRELNRNTPKLREAVGDDTYDRYLYAMGRKNRVVVTSVIPGSAADQAGIRQGDMILDYGDSRVFNWSELRKATTEGYRGEYITVNVQRGEQIMSLLVPRGPLGVRMSPGRRAPLDNPGY